MKKIISIFLIAAFAANMAGKEAAAGTPDEGRPDKINSDAVAELIRDYNLEEGFEVVSVGGLGLGLIRMMAKVSADNEEDRAAIEIIDQMKRIIVVDYGEVEASRKTSFERKITSILDKGEKIMEIKDEDDMVNIYGAGSDDGDSISDLIIYNPGECALICLFGKISSKKIADLIVMANE